MIIYDTEVILNERKKYIFPFFYFFKKDSFFCTISVRDFVGNKLTLVCLFLPRCHLVSRNAGIETLVIFRPVAFLCRFDPLTLCSKLSDIASEFIHLFVLISKMTYPANAHAPLIFALTPCMNKEEVLQEIHDKVECSNRNNKTIRLCRP